LSRSSFTGLFHLRPAAFKEGIPFAQRRATGREVTGECGGLKGGDEHVPARKEEGMLGTDGEMEDELSA
jgi:hypothetical protein